MDIEIRQAKSGELVSLVELLRTCIASMRLQGIDQWDDVYPDNAILQRDIKDGAAFVAATAGVIVGMATLNEYQEPEYLEVPWLFSGRLGVIHRLMITPAAEGKGVARALMGFLEARGKHLGYSCIRLDAFCGKRQGCAILRTLFVPTCRSGTFPQGPFLLL